MPNVTRDIPGEKKMKVGIVGGGAGAFFASLHRASMRLSNCDELVAGVFSSNKDKSQAAASALGVDPSQVYDCVEEMAGEEAAHLDGIDAVVIIAPNRLHFEACHAFLMAGIPVICDEPLVNETSQANKLIKLAKESNAFFGVTHTYQGYPMVRETRQRINLDDLGDVRFIYVEYFLGWLAPCVERLGGSLTWRGEPDKAGISSVVGDIGTHAFNMMEFLTGQQCVELSAKLPTKVPGRKMDGSCVAQLKFDPVPGLAQGARGVELSHLCHESSTEKKCARFE